MTIEQLEAKIAEARKAYYNLDPIISDTEYDELVDQLTLLRPNSQEVVAVGAKPSATSVWPKVEHEIVMGSLTKVTSEAEFREWAAKTGASEFAMTTKIDGSSMELVYEAGKLLRCVTRGDGIVGEDVTPNVIQIPNIPRQIPWTATRLTIRGEVVMTKDIFQSKYSSEYANPRNTAAGKIRDKSGAEACKDLRFYGYFTSVKTKDFAETLRFLAANGFSTPELTSFGTIEDMVAAFTSAESNRGQVSYEIDGMVVQVNDTAHFDSLGSLNMRPIGSTAYKFTAQTGVSRVRDVIWSVGPTGRISPVAAIDPVNIGGVVISRVSLHNLDMFRELDLQHGCRVLVSRRNEVIPYIESKLND